MNNRDDAASRLRIASDNVVIAAQELLALEGQKRQLAPADPRFRALAEDARRLAEEVLRLVDVCIEEAREIEEGFRAAGVASINATPPNPSLAPILEEWRAVERKLALSVPGSPETDVLIERFHALRARYTTTAAQLINDLKRDF